MVNQSILYLIPARGGSKGIPGKNIKPLNGKPLIVYSIEIAKKMASKEDICISTDNDEIIQVVEKTGLYVPFKRPVELSTDNSPTEDTIKQALDFYQSRGRNYDILVLLQPTSPFRTVDQIQSAIDIYLEQKPDMVVSVKETPSNPYYVLFEEDKSGFLHKSKDGKFTRRQDCPKVWEYNGSIFIINVKSLIEKGMQNFEKKVKFEMEDRYSVDLDTQLDWEIAEYLSNKWSDTE